jgi:hypothetical protein
MVIWGTWVENASCMGFKVVILAKRSLREEEDELRVGGESEGRSGGWASPMANFESIRRQSLTELRVDWGSCQK